MMKWACSEMLIVWSGKGLKGVRSVNLADLSCIVDIMQCIFNWKREVCRYK